MKIAGFYCVSITRPGERAGASGRSRKLVVQLQSDFLARGAELPSDGHSARFLLLSNLPLFPSKESSTSKSLSVVSQAFDDFQIIKSSNSPAEKRRPGQLWEPRNKKLFMVTFVDINISTESGQPGDTEQRQRAVAGEQQFNYEPIKTLRWNNWENKPLRGQGKGNSRLFLFPPLYFKETLNIFT